MTDRDDPTEAVGSVAEEAVKLMTALGDWARDHGEEAAGAARSVADHLAGEQTTDHEDHGSAPRAPECRWCPLCQALHVVRGTSPEVRAHLAGAATSLAQAFAAMMASPTPQPRDQPGDQPRGQRSTGVEHIDLDDEEEHP